MPRKPRLVGGVKGHNMNEISFARFRLATTCPEAPPCLPRPNGVGGELHLREISQLFGIKEKEVLVRRDMKEFN